MIRLVLLIFVSISSSSVFATQMQIKLLNQSGQTIKTDKVYWSAVGKPRPNICFWETTLQNGGSSIGTCTEQPSTDRWKRKVFLQFYCARWVRCLFYWSYSATQLASRMRAWLSNRRCRWRRSCKEESIVFLGGLSN